MTLCCPTYPCRRTTGGCPICDPKPPNYQWVNTTLPSPPMGCICPPTSEKTCESPVCPRKNHLRAGIGPNTVTMRPVTNGTRETP